MLPFWALLIAQCAKCGTSGRFLGVKNPNFPIMVLFLCWVSLYNFLMVLAWAKFGNYNTHIRWGWVWQYLVYQNLTRIFTSLAWAKCGNNVDNLAGAGCGNKSIESKVYLSTRSFAFISLFKVIIYKSASIK